MCMLPPGRPVRLVLRSPDPGPDRPSSRSPAPGQPAVTDHLKWARAVAHGVRREFHFLANSQEEKDLEATAYLALVELAPRFDPAKMPSGAGLVDAFRGWAAVEVRCRCRREARRLRNGGTYHTRREIGQKALVVRPLKCGRDMIDPRSQTDADGEGARL